MATDKSLLHHILTNLLANALKFTPDGGKVVIRVEREGTFAKISVSDTGIGIPQEKIHTIWEPFRQIDGTASRSYGGAGLGLAVVARLAKLLKADVSVASKVGVGTTFCVTLDGCTVSD
jgi:signal transduction histidine kinase